MIMPAPSAAHARIPLIESAPPSPGPESPRHSREIQKDRFSPTSSDDFGRSHPAANERPWARQRRADAEVAIRGACIVYHVGLSRKVIYAAEPSRQLKDVKT
jgi:hypothetical protein